MGDRRVSFPNTPFPDLLLGDKVRLAEQLTIQNSPILFGCRTGLCGTCLVKVTGHIAAPLSEEAEVLQILAPDDPQARLACQIELTADIEIAAYEV